MKERNFNNNRECISDIGKLNICSNCVRENYLLSKIKRLKRQDTCHYCNHDGTTITIAEMADEIEAALESHYQRTSPEPSDLEMGMIRHGIRDWERDGEPVIQVICDVAQINEKPAEHIRRVLANRNCDRIVENYQRIIEEFGYEGPFDEDAQYIEKDVDDKEYHERWSNFEHSIKTKTRFFSKHATATLDSIFDVLLSPQYNSESLIIEAGPNQDVDNLYRARMFESEKELSEALKRPDLHLGPPPAAKARANRMNASGISVFYGATSAKVAISEIRPPVGSFVLVGAFKVIRKIRLLDVIRMDTVHAHGSVFDPNTVHRMRKAKFLQALKERIMKAVTPYDEPSEYLATQIIAEYLADRSDLELDGIMYSSIQTGAGSNVMLFHRSSRSRFIDIPDNVQIDVSFDHVNDEDMGYMVSEQTPDANKTGKLSHDVLDENVDLLDRCDTLEIDLESLKVHNIKAAKYDTECYNVSRYRLYDLDDSEF